MKEASNTWDKLQPSQVSSDIDRFIRNSPLRENSDFWHDALVLLIEKVAYQEVLKARKEEHQIVLDRAHAAFKAYMADESDERELMMSYFVSQEVGKRAIELESNHE